eukprot:12404359-Karenia_brevis.AAC.1
MRSPWKHRTGRGPNSLERWQTLQRRSSQTPYRRAENMTSSSWSQAFRARTCQDSKQEDTILLAHNL